MNTQLMEYMIAIAEERSLSRAAERLMISQPALSRQLGRLETELGTKLFLREHNSMILTDAGRIYVNGARSILSIYSGAVKKIQRLHTSRRKQITLVYNNGLLPEFSSRVLPAFRKLHGDVMVSTIYGNASVARDYLENGMADLAVIATGGASWQLLDSVPLRSEELILALPADHPCVPEFEAGGVDFSLLEQDPFILNQVNSYIRSLEREIFRDLHLNPNILCEIADQSAALNMVQNHKGVAFIPRSMESRGEGCVCFPLNPRVFFQVVIAWNKSTMVGSVMQDLIRLMKDSGRDDQQIIPA